jgi:hypothetical protein
MNICSSPTQFSNHCPECDAPIHFTTNIFKGLQVTCTLCKTRLEVIEINPLKLDWAFIALKKNTPVHDYKNEGELS